MLQNILAQNPQFYCSPTSGVLELLYGARSNFTTCPEFKAQDVNEMREAFASFCYSGLIGFYAPKRFQDKSIVVDKSRGWIGYYDWLKSFWPNPKVLVCIRDLRGIFSSMEKLHRNNPDSHMAGEDPGKMQMITVDARVGYWLTNPPIGLALQRLSDLVSKGHDKDVLFVKFESLTKNATTVLDGFYEYINAPRFEHNLYKVEQTTKENDLIYGIPDLHTIREKVEPVKPDWNDVLGKHLSQLIVEKHRWYYERFYPEVV